MQEHYQKGKMTHEDMVIIRAAANRDGLEGLANRADWAMQALDKAGELGLSDPVEAIISEEFDDLMTDLDISDVEDHSALANLATFYGMLAKALGWPDTDGVSPWEIGLNRVQYALGASEEEMEPIRMRV